MKPISCLMRTSFENMEECYRYYNKETGGLRRRLEVLKKLHITFIIYIVKE
ncbi:hypothetical protein V3433_06495 [Fusobacterium polymorphum]